jgi:hypothetical protein
VGDEMHLHRLPASGTNWNIYQLQHLWDMVRLEDGTIGWRQYDAWRRMAEICTDQADMLDDAVAKLTQRWPANPASASEAFALWMKGLTTSMRQSAEAAQAARQAISQITSTFSRARSEISQLVADEQRYAYVEQAMIPQPTPSPGQSPPPVRTSDMVAPPPGWREDLTQRARDVMAATEQTVASYAAALREVPPFELRRDGTGPELEPSAEASGASGATDSMQIPYIPMPTNTPSSFDPGPLVGAPTGGGGALPILAGGPGSSPMPSLGTPTPPSSPGVSALNPPLGGGLPMGVAFPVGAVGPGGVLRVPGIAEAPHGAARNPTSGPTPSASTGIAGSGRSAAGPHAAGMMPMAPMVPPPVGGSAGSSSGIQAGGRVTPAALRRRSSDPNDPWAVREGAPAVLEPTHEAGDFDPGPGVIGLDR